MSVIAAIAAQRQKLLDGIDANEGDINLRIFEDFYPDEAHFIYELLQNAEDAGATEVAFELDEHSCSFEHNGSRHFNERDIRGITGIFNSSKADDPDKIGKFGVGFKSVFVYTETPVIYSRDHSFRILKLVLPQVVPSKPELGERTRFEFLFNNPKKTAEAAYAEVKAGLEKLSETTLLFLNNLRYIKWKVGDLEGAVLREKHSEAHVEVLKLAGGKEVLSSHWLRFAEPIQNVAQYAAPVEGVERQKVAIAFELQLTGDAKSFDKGKPLARQMKIVPAVQGTVSVFFPADKETSGLRFHLHGPFVPELSRASIKNSQENVPLFAQLASLTAKSLHAVRDAGFLSGEFLAVLPNGDDNLPERYDVIRRAILAEMKAEPLVPTYGGGFAPAFRLVQARASLKALLAPDDLALVTGRDDKPDWAIGITQRNSNQDRLLGSLGIKNWDADDLKGFFETRARKPNSQWERCGLDQEVVNWIDSKSFEWLQALYSLLYKYCEDTSDYGHLSDVYFIKLTSGNVGTGAIAYFMDGSARRDDPLARVDNRVLTAGTKKGQQEDARHFLEKLEVREPNEVDEMVLLLRLRYGEKMSVPTDKVYLADLKRMIRFSEKHPQNRQLFAKAFIFRVEAPKFEWATAGHVFVDEPYGRTDLRLLHAAIADQTKRRWALSSWYKTSGVPADKLAKFAAWAGCQTEFDKLYAESSCAHNPNWGYLSSAPGQRWGNGINRDFELGPQALALIKAKSIGAVLLVWKALCRTESVRPTVLKACYQYTDRGGPHYSDSQLVCTLKQLAWIPQVDGTFVKPSAALASRLPEGFAVDAGYKWLEALAFGTDEKKRATDSAVRAAKRAELGFQSEEELERAKAFLQLPEVEQRRVLEAALRQSEPVELPERPVRNPIRQKRVVDEAKNTPDRQSEIRDRSVQLGVAEAKAAAKAYLSDQYTNSQGKMVCQVCKDELPFKLPSGTYYFEAVEVVPESPKRYREGFLALCPNHAAAYSYANAQRNQMLELVATSNGNEIEVALGGEVTTIYFTQMHLADAKACLSSRDNEE